MSQGFTSAAAACALLLAAVAGPALAAQSASDPSPPQGPPMTGGAQTLPPKYLSVPDFKSCLSTDDRGSYQSWCLPRRKPGQCSQDSWASLKALKGADALPKCARAASRPR